VALLLITPAGTKGFGRRACSDRIDESFGSRENARGGALSAPDTTSADSATAPVDWRILACLRWYPLLQR
jgi:hypothetical protein